MKWVNDRARLEQLCRYLLPPRSPRISGWAVKSLRARETGG